MKQNTKSAKTEYDIIMDFVGNDKEMISVIRNGMLNATLLALANDESLINPKRRKSEYLKFVSFLEMLNTCVNDIENEWDRLEERSMLILKNAFVLDDVEPSSKTYTSECRQVLITFMVSVLCNSNAIQTERDFADLIYLFEALKQLIDDVEKYLFWRTQQTMTGAIVTSQM